MKRLFVMALALVAISATAWAQEGGKPAEGPGGKIHGAKGPCRKVFQACKAQNVDNKDAIIACVKSVRAGSADEASATAALASAQLAGHLTEKDAIACHNDPQHFGPHPGGGDHGSKSTGAN